MKWIKVEDKLPEFNEKALVYFGHIDNILMASLFCDANDNPVWCVYYSDGAKYQTEDSEIITHWYALPSAPNEENTEG